jgi:3-mercaptopyruvate sulfurtransferase SseA
VILYCTCPSEESSAKVALQLHRLGITRVRPLRGGFNGWKSAGYPLFDYAEEAEVAVTEAIGPERLLESA